LLALELAPGKTDAKGFMAKLLRENVFDKFEMRHIEIATNVKVTLEGAQADENGEKLGFSAWSTARPLVYEIIRLCPRPRQMKIVLSQKDAAGVHANAAALFLNILYENDSVTFTTATAQKEFSLDKSLDSAWDDLVRRFFASAEIYVRDRELE